MAPTLRNTPKSYRSCILYEFQLGRSIDEAYRNFCRETKNDNFYYVEFAHWFSRFANGKFDLDDESFDIQPKSFWDLPNEILGKVVEKLDLVSRLKTRKVSRILRYVVDKQNAHYDEIRIPTKPNQISIYFDKNAAHYIKNDDKCLMEYQCEGMEFKQKHLNGDFLEIALNDLEIAMKKPSLQLEKLSFSFNGNAEFEKEKILNLLKSLKSPIRVKSLQVGTARGEDFLSILSMLKPGTLERIRLVFPITDLNVNELVEMDQWKQAKKVDIGLAPIGIEHCIHFDEFVVNGKPLSTQDVLRLLDVLSKSTNFEYCLLCGLNIRLNIADIGTALGATVVQYDIGPIIRHRHPIPGSNNFLDIDIRPSAVTIKKIT